MKKKLLFCLQSCSLNLPSGLARNLFLFFGVLMVSLPALSQGPGHPNVNAGDDVTLDCGEECTELTASYLHTGDTETYSVSSIPYAPPFPFTGGTPVSVNIDDRWSNAITLPFEFCFYGQVYTQMVIGSNAVVSFDLAQNPPNSYCSWSFDELIPNPNLFHAAIFGPYMDTNPAVAGSGTINWTVFGTAPDRTMVVNFPEIPYFSCTSSKLTSQIVMYETTNVIEIYVGNRPGGCTWNDGNAVIGIQNQTGLIGESAPGRNTGNWSATNEAWRFTPNGEPNVVFSWLDADGNVIGNTDTINVCPDDQVTVYTAQAIYTNCNGDVVTVTDDVTVTKTASFSVDLGGDQELCEASEYMITAEITNGDPDQATYLWSTGETTPSIIVTTSGTYSVEVTIGDCTLTKQVVINFNDRPIIDLGDDITTCFDTPIMLNATPSNYGSGEVEYKWFKDGNEIAGATTATYLVTELGVYTVEVTKNGCTGTDVINITQENLIVSLGGDITSCFDVPEIITAEAMNYDPTSATYEWFFDGVLIVGANDQDLEITQPGTYTVEVTLGACTASDTMEATGGTIDVSLPDDFETCFEAPVVLEATLSDPTATAIFEWSFNGNIIPDENNSTLVVTEIGTYTVTATSGSCTGTDSIVITGSGDLEVEIGPDFQTCPKEKTTLTAVTSEEGVTFQWFLNGTAISGATNNTLEVQLEEGTMGTQTYMVVITSGGCTGEASINVSLYPVGNCVISQGISPNGDGFNDNLDLSFLNDRTGIKKLQIFNRYGTRVFEQNSYTNQWKGQDQDGKDLPTGTYFYVIDLDGNDSVYGPQATGWIYLNQKAN